MTGPVSAYIGLGSNQGHPVEQLCRARRELDELPDSATCACSSLYRSAPVGYAAQPDYINAVCRLKTRLAAADLLAGLHAIEGRHGRIRDGRRNRPRSLDLDLLLYGAERINETGLVVPHPRLQQRAFVLYPLAEIALGNVIPGGEPLDRLLESVSGQRVERLGPVAAWIS